MLAGGSLSRAHLLEVPQWNLVEPSLVHRFMVHRFFTQFCCFRMYTSAVLSHEAVCMVSLLQHCVLNQRLRVNQLSATARAVK